MKRSLCRLRDWIMAPLARVLAERNALLDHRNYILSGALTDAEWIRMLKMKNRK